MVRLANLSAALLGCGALLMTVARGDEAVKAESCETTAYTSFPEDEFAVCNVGSSCREEYNRANGSESDMWPGEEASMARTRLQSERSRVKLNEYQPAIVPKFTELGYKKEKLNPTTYAYLMEWYTAMMESREPTVEKWPPDNTYVNHWKVDTTMLFAPGRVHNRLFKDLQPLMEQWSGTKLKSTACYGVRNYFRGSVLANHVDRVDTHVISGIINVEQENVDTDWPLYVRGHDGVARNLYIEPGEIIFYESASVIHGRPEAFQGDRFANIFVHFTPVEGWDIKGSDVDRAARHGSIKKQREADRAEEAKAKAA
eukprot:g5816.t1